MSLRAILLDRGRFDRVLAEYAEGNAKIIKRRIKEENLKEMKAIIGADGPLSTVARAFDFDDLSYAIAYQRELIGNKEFENVIKVYFFRNSFGYVIPNFRRKIVGIVFFKGPKRDFAERFFNSVRGENEREIENFSAVIPIKMRKEISKRLGERRIHLTGDAAGIVKSTSGGGIYYGCLYSYYLGKYFYDEEKLKKAELDIRRRLRLHELLRGVLNKNLFLKLLSLFPRLRISYDMEDVYSVDFEKLFNSFSLSFHEEKNRI
jgi:flavin-dependent dehydrogenase